MGFIGTIRKGKIYSSYKGAGTLWLLHITGCPRKTPFKEKRITSLREGFKNFLKKIMENSKIGGRGESAGVIFHNLKKIELFP